ncbi:MAG: sugar phosphorylase [Verrucomicrobiota bacterium]
MSPAPAGWSENDSFLITYAETLAEKKAPPLATLSRFLKNHCPDILSFIHILPFYPSTSDHGFSVVDYRKVATDLGSWNDVENLARERRVTFDCVLNHVSQESDYVQGFISGNTDREDFCIVESSAFDSSQVTRPRQSPLFHSFDRPDQSQVSLWTTFSRDQVDLNFRNPAVLIEILDILLGYAARGASMIRLDAIPYLWKESGTTCIHLKQTHEIIRLIRAVFDAVSPHVILLSETNVPHQENIKYFGPDERDEAQIIYNFSLAPLLLHTVHTGNATALTHWASNLDDFGEACTYLNVTATHDGIGIRPAEDCLAPDDRSRLLEITSAHGGFVNYKRNADGSDTPYELNITWFDALNNPHSNPPTPLSLQIDRMVLSQAIPMALKGIPALYIHSLLGSRNDLSRVNPGDSTTFRTINRSQISIDTLLQDLNDPTTRRHQVFHALTKLLRIRQTQPAFHPDAAQQILDLGPHTFALLRQSQSSSLVQSIIAVFNVTAQPQTIPTSSLPLSKEPLTDLISGQPIAAPEISINPYQFRWLTTPR